jgi:hypothetical protein
MFNFAFDVLHFALLRLAGILLCWKVLQSHPFASCSTAAMVMSY